MPVGKADCDIFFNAESQMIQWYLLTCLSLARFLQNRLDLLRRCYDGEKTTLNTVPMVEFHFNEVV